LGQIAVPELSQEVSLGQSVGRNYFLNIDSRVFT
jgi:hypothetical protein